MKIDSNLKKKSGIYKITCNSNGNFYIGSSVNLLERLQIHLSHLRGNYHHSYFMQKSYNKYGEDSFKIEILEFCENNIIVLREKELDYINLNNPKFNSTTPITYEHSDEMKTKISNTLKKKYKEDGIVNPRFQCGKKIDVYDCFGNLLHKGIFVEDAVKKLNISNRSVINNSLRKGNLIVKKIFIICLENENYIDNLIKWIKTNSKVTPKVIKFDLNSEQICNQITMTRIGHKILDSDNLLYYSERTKSYYTFAGLCKYHKNKMTEDIYKQLIETK